MALALIRLVSRIGCRPDRNAFMPLSGNHAHPPQHPLSIFSSFRFYCVLFPALTLNTGGNHRVFQKVTTPMPATVAFH
ncbi:hypothetical protein KCP78_21515 [Salmonella enterica subsp. enterica]|nr:hypothetical protein KCP78_21515 [Salmonella enterica subsp. enterica]